MNIETRAREMATTIISVWGDCVWQQLEPVDKEKMLTPIKSALQEYGDFRAAEMREECASIMKAMADTAYCKALDVAQSPPCLGWEAKIKSGKFGKEEMEAHKKSNEMMGEHTGLHKAIRALPLPSERKEP